MSAQDTPGASGAPSRVTLDDAFAAFEARDFATVRAFFDRLRALPAAADHSGPDESAGFAIEHAVQSGFDNIDDDCELYVVSERDLAAYTLALNEHSADRRRLLRELDVALNGEAGAAKQASLCDLVAQVERQRAVQIVNFDDGMVINFRAPDGRRATLNLAALLGGWRRDGEPVAAVMADAIASYPSVGPRVPVEEPESLAAGVRRVFDRINGTTPDEPFGSDVEEGGIRDVIMRRYDEDSR